MKTPIFDFVKGYAADDISRFHMPGHKGTGPLGCEVFDITEISGADTLYLADGIIAESENNASALFGTAHSYYSTEGSSLVIKAMLALVTRSAQKGKRPLILASRNAHKAFIYSCALLDLDVTWLYPKEQTHICACSLSVSDVEKAISEADESLSAVYITSPDYLGNISDIKGISEVCHAHNIPLLVDNAHGAYLKFFDPSSHPISLGADMCCDSAHKTLPVLTGGAYLHISSTADPEYLSSARDMLSVFASTSPSYLILESLDLCNAYLANGYPESLSQCIEKIKGIRERISALGFKAELSEPLKLIIDAKGSGYNGKELTDLIRKYKLEPEFSDDDFIVFMITPSNRETDLNRLVAAFEKISPKKPIEKSNEPLLNRKKACVSIRNAIFSTSEALCVDEAEGRICAAPTVSCPPAIPIIISGERIERSDIALLKRYGIKTIRVLKQV